MRIMTNIYGTLMVMTKQNVDCSPNPVMISLNNITATIGICCCGVIEPIESTTVSIYSVKEGLG